MQIHFLVNETMHPFLYDYFLPSIPRGLEPIHHSCEINSTGSYACDGYFDILERKIENLVATVASFTENELILWTDVDIVFNRNPNNQDISIPQELELLARGKDLLFQREFRGRQECNTGVQLIRCNERTLRFYTNIKRMLQDIDPNDQTCVNNALRSSSQLSWGHLPLAYSSQTNRGLTSASRLFHANGTVKDSMNAKFRLLEKALLAWM